MLVTAVHHLARLGREQRVEIVIAALDAAFEKVVSGAVELGCGQPDAYPGGRLACWKIKGASVLAWTDARQRILSLAVGRGMQPQELLRWWQLDSGPI